MVAFRLEEGISYKVPGWPGYVLLASFMSSLNYVILKTCHCLFLARTHFCNL